MLCVEEHGPGEDVQRHAMPAIELAGRIVPEETSVTYLPR